MTRDLARLYLFYRIATRFQATREITEKKFFYPNSIPFGFENGILIENSFKIFPKYKNINLCFEMQ